MGRWEPDAARRLREAAFELFLERGYDHTTVADIAERAGLTSRTFFRYFDDKREVLFAGTTALQEAMTTAVAGAPAGSTAIELVGAALEAVAASLPARSIARRRHVVISSTPELQERELIKLSQLSMALADALRARGVADPAAALAADAGIVVFRSAFERWVTGRAAADLSALMRDTLRLLASVTAA